MMSLEGWRILGERDGDRRLVGASVVAGRRKIKGSVRALLLCKDVVRPSQPKLY